MLRAVALIATLILALAACEAETAAGSSRDHPPTLDGTSWTVVAINGLGTPRGAQPTIEFAAATVKGSGPCNRFGGSYGYDAATGELRFDGLGMTAMACAEAARNEVEAAFTQVLGQPSLIATLQPEGHLVLLGSAGGRIELVSGLTIID